jgi:Flp pilus assembly pilin Flp
MPMPPSARPLHQRGAATVEYCIVAALAVLVLVAQPSVIEQLLQALRDAYASFTYALSFGS